MSEKQPHRPQADPENQPVDPVDIPVNPEDTVVIPEENSSPAEKIDTTLDTISPENRKTDVELLGRTYPVRQAIHGVENTTMAAVEHTSATLKNVADTPKKFRLALQTSLLEQRKNRYEKTYNRKKEDFEAHLQELKDQEDTLGMTPPKTRFEKHRHDKELARINKRRRKVEKKLHKVETKFNRRVSAHTEAKDKLEGHKSMMRGRHETVTKNHEQRKNEVTTELINKKNDALARKRLRRQIRQEAARANERVSRRELKSIINDIPPDVRKQLGNVVLYEESAKRDSRKVSRAEHRAESREESAYNKAKNTFTSLRAESVELKNMTESQKSLENDTIPTLKQQLQETIQLLSAAIENDDQNATSLQTELNELQALLKSKKDELSSLQSAQRNQRERIAELRKKYTAERNVYEQMKEEHYVKSDETKKRQATHEQYKNNSQQAAEKASVL